MLDSPFGSSAQPWVSLENLHAPGKMVENALGVLSGGLVEGNRAAETTKLTR